MTSLSDDALLDRVQRQTLRYFWDFGHPASGMARERSNPVPGYDFRDTVTTGGTGFGIMAMIAGAARGFLPRDEVRKRVARIVDFLAHAERHHGVLPHFLHGGTGATIPFSPQDDGGDLVETAFLIAGLLCARQYFSDDARLGADIDRLWHAVEWDWHTRGDSVLYWHWSPRHDWAMNHAIRGWNECLIAYVLAAASPTHPIAPEVYHRGWTDSPTFRNGKTYDGITLPLGPPQGGPLFFAHYSFLGLDPRGLSDRYADYWAQNRAHALINRAHCIANPHKFAGYGANCWGLTACDGDRGQARHVVGVLPRPGTLREDEVRSVRTPLGAATRCGGMDAVIMGQLPRRSPNSGIDHEYVPRVVALGLFSLLAEKRDRLAVGRPRGRGNFERGLCKRLGLLRGHVV